MYACLVSLSVTLRFAYGPLVCPDTGIEGRHRFVWSIASSRSTFRYRRRSNGRSLSAHKNQTSFSIRGPIPVLSTAAFPTFVLSFRIPLKPMPPPSLYHVTGPTSHDRLSLACIIQSKRRISSQLLTDLYCEVLRCAGLFDSPRRNGKVSRAPLLLLLRYSSTCHFESLDCVV